MMQLLSTGTTTIFLLLVVASLATVLVSGAAVPGGRRGREAVPRSHVSVGRNSTYCKTTQSILYCDYQWKEQEVTLEAGSEEEVTLFFLQSLHRLTLHHSACLNLSLKNVADARVEGHPSTSCSRMTLNLLNATLDLLADPFTNVNAQDSRIKEVRLRSLEEQLTLIGSSVGVLEVGEVRGDGRVSVKIHSTSIGRLESLKVAESAKVILQNSVISDVPLGALVLASSGNSFSKVKFPAGYDRPPATLELLPGADVTLEDVSGRVTVVASHPASSSTTRGLSNTHQHTSTSPPPGTDHLEDQQPVYCSQHYLLIVFLVLSLTVNVILLSYVLYQKILFYKQPHKSLPKGDKCVDKPLLT